MTVKEIKIREHFYPTAGIPVVWLHCTSFPDLSYGSYTFEWRVPTPNPVFIILLTMLLASMNAEEYLMDETVILYKGKYGA